MRVEPEPSFVLKSERGISSVNCRSHPEEAFDFLYKNHLYILLVSSNNIVQPE